MIKTQIKTIIILATLISLILIVNKIPKLKASYTTTIYASKDTFISEQVSTSNFGSHQYLLLGTYSGKRRHVLLYFKLSTIPYNAVIISAKLVLKKYSQAAFTTSFKSFYVKLLSKYWFENYATWEKRTNTLSWSNYGGDYYTSPYSYFVIYKTDPTIKTYEIDVTTLVIELHKHNKPNYGFIIYPAGTADGYVYFYSREYTGNVKDRPKLIIKYNLPSISVSVSPSTKTVVQGESTTFQVTVAAQYYSGIVQLSLTGLPSGVTYSFNPSQGTPPFNSILTIATSSSTPVGTHTITVKGTGTGVSDQKTITLKVVKPAAFILSLSPPSLTIQQGGSGTTTITVNPISGYNKKVTISLISAPPGVTASFSTNPVNPGSSTTATIHVSASATPGTYSVVFKGVGEDGKEATATLSLTITEKPFDFIVKVSPKTITVDEGQDAVITIQVDLLSGTGKPVTLSLLGLPAGTTYSFSTTTITPPGTSVLTIKTTGLTGTYTVTIKGKHGTVEKTDSFTLKITKFDFSISVSPKSLEVNQGETAQVVITVNLVSGTAKPVSLSAIGVPSGATYTLSPMKVTPPGSAVLTINTGSAKGTYTVIVKGTGDGKEKTDTFIITIKEKKCIIATATYGSEVSDEVNLLRRFRDNIVLSTYAGQRFYTAFNTFYYSWSPQIAQIILKCPELKIPMRIVLYPLLGTLLFATTIVNPIVPLNSELAVYLAGTIISILLGIIYVTPVNMTLDRIFKRKIFTKKTSLKLTYITMGILIASIMAQILTLDLVLTITTAAYVVMLIVTSSYIATTKILNTYKQRK